MKGIKRFITLSLAVIFVCVSLAGCRGNTPTGNESKVSEEDKYGGTLIYPINDPQTLLYWFTGLNYDRYSNVLNDVLFTIDLDSGEIGYRLCESYDVSKDKLEYTFHIRDKVYWHDGVQLTADDVVWSHDIWYEEDWPYPQSWSIPGKWEAIDPLTVQVTLEEPNSQLLELMYRYLSVQPKHCFEGVAYSEFFACDAAFKPIGCGPFKFDEYKVGDYVKFKANEDFWNGRPYLDEVIFKVVGAGSEREVAFETQQLSMMVAEASYYNEIKDDTDLYNFAIEKEDVNYGLVDFVSSLNSPGYIEDPEVRRALAYMVDYDSIIKKICYGFASRIKSIVANGVPGYQEVGNYNYDLDKAKKILTDAGYIDSDGDGYREVPQGKKLAGNPVSLQLWYFSAGSPEEYISIILAEAMQECGILAVPYLVDTATFMERFLTNGKELNQQQQEALTSASVGFVASTSYGPFIGEYRYALDPSVVYNPSNFDEETWVQLGGQGLECNVDNYLSIGFDKATATALMKMKNLFESINSAEDDKALEKLYAQIQNVYMNEVIGSIPIYVPWKILALQKNVHIEDSMYDPRVNELGFKTEKIWVK